MRKKLILIGGGGHCKSCIDVIEQSNQFTLVGILDNPALVGLSVLGYDIIGTDDQIEKLSMKGYDFLITIGQIHSLHSIASPNASGAGLYNCTIVNTW